MLRDLRADVSVSDLQMDKIIDCTNRLLAQSALALGVPPDAVAEGVGVPSLGLTARKIRSDFESSFDSLVRALSIRLAALSIGVYPPNQVGKYLYRIHTVEVDLSELPFTPPRTGEVMRVEVRDPIGAAVCLLLDSRCSGKECDATLTLVFTLILMRGCCMWLTYEVVNLDCVLQETTGNSSVGVKKPPHQRS
jgi:hypothetical protein